MAKRGRPPTPEVEKQRIIEHVLCELSAGRPVSRTLCEDNEMCSQDTFWKWIWADENGLAEKVAHARANGIEARLDRALMIAETPMMGEIVTEKPIMVDGKPLEGVTIREVRKEDMLGHRRLLVDTEFKAAQMLKPKTYGPKLDVTSGGEKLPVDDVTRATRLASIMAAIEKRNATD
jgi:hypothetical protein